MNTMNMTASSVSTRTILELDTPAIHDPTHAPLVDLHSFMISHALFVANTYRLLPEIYELVYQTLYKLQSHSQMAPQSRPAASHNMRKRGPPSPDPDTPAPPVIILSQSGPALVPRSQVPDGADQGRVPTSSRSYVSPLSKLLRIHVTTSEVAEEASLLLTRQISHRRITLLLQLLSSPPPRLRLANPRRRLRPQTPHLQLPRTHPPPPPHQGLRLTSPPLLQHQFHRPKTHHQPTSPTTTTLPPPPPRNPSHRKPANMGSKVSKLKEKSSEGKLQPSQARQDKEEMKEPSNYYTTRSKSMRKKAAKGGAPEGAPGLP
ncbi:hypothetical protein GMOD_00008181 [Pyrenophora seminiperda CCB06]|uniref:Uncharacterized protein n=1 Tax=Pyrenophora seminiperda CCB06 TaxID=1302712 RepID=A0A3M7M1S2_9PLEO|nr:hypothetical protein GMOD_00008181 [Pyrenophora seminiperda CCB06]